MSPNESKPPAGKDAVQGEGDYDAARRYDQSVEKFAKSGRVDEAARKAPPQSPEQAAELERAEREGASHSKGEDRNVPSGDSKS
ncbi:MAG: hypothetical protein ABIX46_02865 [Burkholderiaceae bacterium]